jgi:hypothetical protein
MNIYVTYILNFSIIIGAIVGCMRFRRIHPTYYPFIFLIWIGFLNEIISTILVFSGYYNIVNFNIYNLVESLLITWQFYRWRLFDDNRRFYHAMLLTFSFSWLLDILFISGFSHFNSYFRIFYSFAMILMSINMINRMLFKERINFLKNPVFLICSGFIIFFTLTVTTEAFYVYGLKLSHEFQSSVNHILVSANLFCNLIYALAILWMPRRQVFSLQY